MREEHEKLIGIAKKHHLVETNKHWENRKGRDTDIYYYDEVNDQGQVVAKYIVREEMSVYPPFNKTSTWEKEELQ